MMGYKDAAEFLGLPLGTLYSLVSARRIPHVRYGTRLVRFEREALVAWQAARRVLPGEREEGTVSTATNS
jgi:excisionase family DNA binding protein